MKTEFHFKPEPFNYNTCSKIEHILCNNVITRTCLLFRHSEDTTLYQCSLRTCLTVCPVKHWPRLSLTSPSTLQKVRRWFFKNWFVIFFSKRVFFVCLFEHLDWMFDHWLDFDWLFFIDWFKTDGMNQIVNNKVRGVGGFVHILTNL